MYHAVFVTVKFAIFNHNYSYIISVCVCAVITSMEVVLLCLLVAFSFSGIFLQSYELIYVKFLGRHWEKKEPARFWE